MTDRTKAVMMVFGLANQLNAWLEYSRSFGFMTQKFKQDSGMLSRLCDKFIRDYGASDPEVYEHSVQVSELFERIAKMPPQDIKRVYGLLERIDQNK